MAKKEKLKNDPVADFIKDQEQQILQTPPAEIPEVRPIETVDPQVREQAIKDQQRTALATDIANSTKPEQALAPAQSLETTNVDPYVAAAAEAQRNEQRSFADYVQSMRDDYERQRQEGEQQIKDDLNAARWTGLTELAASIANMVGVGQGNAVSQQYKSYSQDWMQKADQSIREHRSRMDNLRQRQRDAELKMNQLRTQGLLAMSKAKVDAEQARAMAEYRRAQVAYQNARTEAAKQKAADDARKAEVEIQAILALANQREASARGNLIRAGATAQNAASRQSSVENQNANRDARTGSQNMVDLSRAAANWSRASGQNIPLQPGWSVQTPQTQAPSGNLPTAPSANNTTPSSLPVPPSRRRR